MKPAFDQQRCLNIAHRGASSVCPENTASACRAAKLAGADAWEFDLRLSADGRVVVIHDPDVLRTSDFYRVFPGETAPDIRSLSLSELRRLDFGAFGPGFSGCGMKSGPERILTLDGALVLSRETGLLANAEIKDCGPETNRTIARALADCIRKRRVLNTVLVSSFDFDVLRFLREQDPDIRIGVLFDSGEVVQADKWRGINPSSCHVPRQMISFELVRYLKKQGVRTYAYTVDDAAEMRGCLELGVSGIFTNRPERLGALLSGEHPQLV